MTATSSNAFRSFFIAGAAIGSAAALSVAPAAAHDWDDDDRNYSFSFDGFSYDNDEDLLTQLIELDADDIAELRADMADARAEIRDAIGEIDEARAEASAAPGGAAIVRVALRTASKVVTKETNKAFDEILSDLTDAEAELNDTRAEVGEAEYAETSLAIEVLREEIASLREALVELTDEMSA